MSRELMEYLAKIANEHDCSIMLLDKNVWTAEKLVLLLDKMKEIVEDGIDIKVH